MLANRLHICADTVTHVEQWVIVEKSLQRCFSGPWLWNRMCWRDISRVKFALPVNPYPPVSSLTVYSKWKIQWTKPLWNRVWQGAHLSAGSLLATLKFLGWSLALLRFRLNHMLLMLLSTYQELPLIRLFCTRVLSAVALQMLMI